MKHICSLRARYFYFSSCEARGTNVDKWEGEWTWYMCMGLTHVDNNFSWLESHVIIALRYREIISRVTLRGSITLSIRAQRVPKFFHLYETFVRIMGLKKLTEGKKNYFDINDKTLVAFFQFIRHIALLQLVIISRWRRNFMPDFGCTGSK